MTATLGGMPMDYQQVLIKTIREGVTQRVSRELADTLTVQQLEDFIGRDLVLSIQAQVLAEELPPVKLTSEQTSPVAVYATWREHFRAAYRETWWGRLLRLRGPRMAEKLVKRVVTTEVRQYWTYPQATTVLPGDRFGHVVLKTETSHRAGAWW